MVTYPTETELLKILAQPYSAKKDIEIGVFTRLSSPSIAEGLPEKGKLICFDVSEEFTNEQHNY